ncbi:PREDICTED: uncharacterized protein LOC107354967 isoform X4 [Acropora digitifera]|nr:PREDICTED: uncharacterized protein LOC107354967 isoform X4 [Acropora digitifera]
MDRITAVILVLVKQVSSSIIICEERQSGYGLLGALGLDTLSTQVLVFSFIVMFIACYNFFNNASRPERMDMEPRDAGLVIPCVHGARLEQVLTTNDKISEKQQEMPRDLKLQAESPINNNSSEILAEDELLLSPVIRLPVVASRWWLNGKHEVHIPHVANMILSFPTWNIILKELGQNGKWQAMYQSDRDGIWKLVSRNNHDQSFADDGQNGKWKAVKQSDENGIWEFVSESNHVKFFTDHLSAFVLVGRCDRSSLSLFKRMKIAAFCGEPKGNCLSVKVYFFDDCDWSYKRVISKEKMEGRRLVSSIESLTFSVTSEDDIAITVKCVQGCQLDESASQLRVSHKSLKNSFTDFPACELQFYSCCPGKVGFFGTLGFTQPCIGETLMLVHVPVDKERFAEKLVERSVKQMEMEGPSGNYEHSDTYQRNQMVTEQGAYSSKPLESLVNDFSDSVEDIFRRLDRRIQGAGHYEVIASYFGFDIFEINLFEKSVRGSSRAMIEAIVVRHPELTIEKFARVVEEKARRRDVADLLRKYDRDSQKGSL